jgi:hypothetical protein
LFIARQQRVATDCAISESHDHAVDNGAPARVGFPCFAAEDDGWTPATWKKTQQEYRQHFRFESPATGEQQQTFVARRCLQNPPEQSKFTAQIVASFISPGRQRYFVERRSELRNAQKIIQRRAASVRRVM